nr:MAG TPA: distal tail protein [Caudoviricetes sp.]
MALKGAKIGNYHTLKDWGLLMKVGSPKIGPAEVDEYLVQVPGSDTMLNLTNSLDGKPHYKKRTITMEFKCIAPKKTWSTLHSTIANAIHGKWLQCVFDDDGAWYWEGLWKVSFTPAEFYCVFTITGTCNPFKIGVYDGSNDWLWDTFNFEKDVVRNYTGIQLTANTETSVPISGAPRTVGVYFKRDETEADISLSLNGSKVAQLAKATDWQYIEGLQFPDDADFTLVFTASIDCKISIRYLGGSL